MSIKIQCGDCAKEKDCEWCEICCSWICIICDNVHDCLADDLELLLDTMIEGDDEGDGHGHA